MSCHNLFGPKSVEDSVLMDTIRLFNDNEEGWTSKMYLHNHHLANVFTICNNWLQLRISSTEEYLLQGRSEVTEQKNNSVLH